MSGELHALAFGEPLHVGRRYVTEAIPAHAVHQVKNAPPFERLGNKRVMHRDILKAMPDAQCPTEQRRVAQAQTFWALRIAPWALSHGSVAGRVAGACGRESFATIMGEIAQRPKRIEHLDADRITKCSVRQRAVNDHARRAALAFVLVLAPACRREKPPLEIDPSLARLVPAGTVLLAGARMDEIRATPLYARWIARVPAATRQWG